MEYEKQQGKWKEYVEGLKKKARVEVK